MPFLSTTATMTGGQPNLDNIYLIKGQPLPSGSALTNPVPINSTDGTTTATLFVSGAAAGVYQGAINIEPGANAGIAGGIGEGITIRTIAGLGPLETAATAVDIGANAQGANHLYISGLSGSSEVYDEVYNKPIKTVGIVDVTTSLNSAVPGESQRGFAFTAPKTGAYMLQVDINYFNDDTTPVISVPVISGVDQVGLFNQPGGAVEWTLTTLPPLPAGEIQFMSTTIAATSLIKQAQLSSIQQPMDFTVSNMGFLQGGSEYAINLYAIKPNPAASPAVAGDWLLSDIRVRLIQMC